MPKVKAAAAVGSSPLTRGKLAVAAASTWGGGLIPAHAGKTGQWKIQGLTFEAHPRSRGENAHDRPSRRKAGGSSPLTRGKLVNRDKLGGLSGLIPAHAGKTTTSRR